MMKFSLILPVYNVENFLVKCVESCLNQDIPSNQYEIIIVIDGSTDKSAEIAKQYQSKYDNVNVVEQCNLGLSAARNTGLLYATGEYIWFIDSDDFIAPNILNGIYEHLVSRELQCLWIQWANIDIEGNVLPEFAPFIKTKSFKVYNGKDFASNILNNFLYAWSFIYKRSFLISNNLSFREGMFFEDTDFAFRAIPLLQRIALYDKVCYLYLQRENSIVHKFSEKKMNDICININNARRRYKENLENSKLASFYKRCYSIFLLMLIKELSKSENYKLMRKKLISFAKKEDINYVLIVGNFVTKLIAIIYNVMGIKTSLNFTCFMSKIKRKIERSCSD